MQTAELASRNSLLLCDRDFFGGCDPAAGFFGDNQYFLLADGSDDTACLHGHSYV